MSHEPCVTHEGLHYLGYCPKTFILSKHCHLDTFIIQDVLTRWRIGNILWTCRSIVTKHILWSLLSGLGIIVVDKVYLYFSQPHVPTPPWSLWPRSVTALVTAVNKLSPVGSRAYTVSLLAVNSWNGFIKVSCQDPSWPLWPRSVTASKTPVTAHCTKH